LPSSNTIDTLAGVQQLNSILLIEDDPASAEIFKFRLSRLGYPIEIIMEAGYLSEAKDLLEKHTFELIFSDLNLPDAKGAEITSLIRNICDTPIIIMSGLDKKHVPKAVLETCKAYLSKDECTSELLDKTITCALK
jgi:CheY-like chemotaxis protein